jgi:hypothetical protein
MLIREYRVQDLAALQDIHKRKGLPPHCMPDPSNPLFVVSRVIEEEGQVQAATFLKLTSEPWLLIDPDVSDRKAVQLITILSDMLELAASNKGLEEMTCWIPPEAGASFGKFLESIGYIKTPWQSYTKVLRK